MLTPLAVDPSHPFPFISNLSLNLAVVVRNPARSTPQFARVKVPPSLSRFIALPDGERFVPIKQVVAADLGRLFEGVEIIDHFPFRVTRSADFAVEEEEANDLLEAMEAVLRFRQRAAEAVRLEVLDEMFARLCSICSPGSWIYPRMRSISGPLRSIWGRCGGSTASIVLT